jgi:hypothetical protein
MPVVANAAIVRMLLGEKSRRQCIFGKNGEMSEYCTLDCYRHPPGASDDRRKRKKPPRRNSPAALRAGAVPTMRHSRVGYATKV